MQIVIDIPQEMWEWLHIGFLDEDDGKHAINAILKGTPLPKGHGRLIDADALYEDLVFPNEQFSKAFKEILDDAPTIIEADKESEDKK